MKTFVIGLDCAAPEILLGDERLTNFRRLMDAGCYGRLESVIPPITVPAWMCMATSQDPGSLGVYGFRNRVDHSYNGLGIVNSRSIGELAIWDQVAREGKRSVIIGVPPRYPPRKVNGISRRLLPDARHDEGRLHASRERRRRDRARSSASIPVDVKGFRTDDKDWLRDEIYAMSRKHFEVVRHFLKNAEWDYFQFVEIGLDRIHHGFWKLPRPRARPARARQPVPGDDPRLLPLPRRRDGEPPGAADDDTIVLVVSDHGAQRLDGGFCVNEWLIREGLLVLNEYPEKVTPFGKLDVNWEKTRVWSEGGYYARVFFNVKGREPQGAIEPDDYERVPRRGPGAVRGDHRRRGAAARDARLPARRDLQDTCATWPPT